MGTPLLQFKDSLKLVTSLKKIENGYSEPIRVKDQPTVRGLRGGMAVLLVASFEFFLANLFEYNIDKVNVELTKKPQTIDFEKLPPKLRVTTVYNSLNRAMKGPLFQESIDKIDRIPNILSACNKTIKKELSPGAFSETGSNPNGDVVCKKFKEIGIVNIFDEIKDKFEILWGSPVANTFIIHKLNSIVKSRHVVAHTADTLHITRRSEDESIKFIEILVRVLNSKFNEHRRNLIRGARI